MNKLWSIPLILTIAILTGCATSHPVTRKSTAPGVVEVPRPVLERRADFGPAYTPFSEFSHHAEVKEGQLISYTLSARDIIPSRMPAVNEALEGLKTKCQYGVRQEVRDENRRRNPAIDPYNRQLAAVIWGVAEQPTLIELRVRFVCNPKPKMEMSQSEREKEMTPRERREERRAERRNKRRY